LGKECPDGPRGIRSSERLFNGGGRKGVNEKAYRVGDFSNYSKKQEKEGGRVGAAGKQIIVKS